ncbi:MAG: YqjF family protein [Bacteroidia bacterium]
MRFLSAEWRKLAIANYEIDSQVLLPYLPNGTELDIWEGHCYVSLVGFMFVNTKMLGVNIPFHTHFEEVNLRFYVKRKSGDTWKRGVVFIKEIVPKMMISFVANTLYNEHYETMEMRHTWTETEQGREVEYQWECKENWHTFRVQAEKEAQEIPIGSEAEFITEHYWGYTKINDQKTMEYEVTHPRWLHYPVINHEIHADFGAIYGADFAFLNRLKPASVMLAEGSEITVESTKLLPLV